MAAAKPRLVIIGSGWAGFYVAERIDLSKYAVTMISPRRMSAYTPLLASAAVGIFNFSLAEETVRSRSRQQLKFIKGNVLDIDFDGKTCKCAPAFEEDPELAAQEFAVEYDYLVIAPGCMPNTFGTPGVEEYGIFIKNVSDAILVRKRLFDLLEMASLPHVSVERKKALLHVAIVGGGPTGIELTAELDDLCRHELRDLYPDVVDYLSISIYDVASHILGAYDKSLYEYATAQLQKRKVDVAPNTKIEKVDKDALHIKDKGSIPYGMLIWATGNKQVPLVEKLDVKLPPRGLKRILTDERCRVFKSGNASSSHEIYDGVFAIGDAADIEGVSLPTTAEVACQKGKYLVDNFNLKEDTAKFTAPFKYNQKQLMSYIGEHDGVIAGRGPNDPGVTGRRAWLAWRGGSLAWNRSWRSRVAIVITWMMNAVFGRDVSKI
ncbi:hypothetical protein DV737_g5461, partial [Chaetothyriales sp. CBS 132003]